MLLWRWWGCPRILARPAQVTGWLAFCLLVFLLSLQVFLKLQLQAVSPGLPLLELHGVQ